MKNRRYERVLNRSLTRDLRDFIEITDARKENRKELIRTILSAIAMMVVFFALLLAATSIVQPDVPSIQTADGEVRL